MDKVENEFVDLNFEVERELHTRIKVASAMSGKSMRDYLSGVLSANIPEIKAA